MTEHLDGSAQDSIQQLAQQQSLLEKLPGVLNARIKTGPRGEICEIHILANQSRSPKQLVRDIQSALLARFDLEIDHRAVSIAQIELAGESLPTLEPRLLCHQVICTHGTGLCSAKVVLSVDQREFAGEATCGSDPFSRRMAVARATLEAVHLFLGQHVFSVVDVKFGVVADWRVTMAAVGLQSDARTQLLLGAVYSDELDMDQSIVKATLDAINRRLWLLVR